MPHLVTHEVAVEMTRKGDKISTKNGSWAPYGAEVTEVVGKTKWVTLFGHELADGTRDVLARRERGSKIFVEREEPTPEERAEQERKWIDDHAAKMLRRLEVAYPTAVAQLRKRLDDGESPSNGDLEELIAGQRMLDHAAHVRRGMKVHGDDHLPEIFKMLRDELAERILSGNTVARWSGGFTVSNAREQLERDVDLKIVRTVDSHFLFYV